MPHSPDELRSVVEDYLEELELWPALHGQAESVRYSITVGGKRVRPVICLATAEAAGARAEDALLAEAFRLATSYDTPHVARELSQATLGMIGGQYLDVTGTAPDEATLHKLKTGCLFAASVGLALWVAGVREDEQRPWRSFADELGLLFQIVDDILDGDGYVVLHGVDGARRFADEAADRARERLSGIDADTSVLREIVDGLAVRTA
jgi:geranylgeranyl diphosphate synthase, type II